MKIVILYSGGMDSLAMLELAKENHKDDEIVLCHYDIGQPYAAKEMLSIKNSTKKVDIRKVDWIRDDSGVVAKKSNPNAGRIFIPGRNLVLATMAASAYLPDEIWMGGLKGEDNPGATDKNKEFVDRTNETMAYVFRPFSPVPKLVFPLVDKLWGKYNTAEYLFNKVGPEAILKTSSCLSDTEGNCGTCITCLKRNYMFKQLGFEEKYEKHAMTDKNNVTMAIEMLKTDHDDKTAHYDKYRLQEIVPGLYIEYNTTDHDVIIKKLQELL